MNHDPKHIPTATVSRTNALIVGIVASLVCLLSGIAIGGLVFAQRNSSEQATSVTITAAVPTVTTTDPPAATDWVATAITPSTGQGGFSTGFTQEGAIKVAMDKCRQAAPEYNDCVSVAAYRACVTFAIVNEPREWAAGHGGTPDLAKADALRQLSNGGVVAGGAYCATPPGS